MDSKHASNEEVPIWNVGGDSRGHAFQEGETMVWWEVQLTDDWQVEDYYVRWLNNFYATDYTLWTSTDQATYDLQETFTGLTTNVVSGSFTGGATAARYFRMEVTGYHDPYADNPDQGDYGPILQRVRLYGPNDPEITPTINLSHEIHNGGSTTSGFEDLISGDYNYTPNMINMPTTDTFRIMLRKRYLVQTLGLAAEGLTGLRVRSVGWDARPRRGAAQVLWTANVEIELLWRRR
jgi:hypothetical protein